MPARTSPFYRKATVQTRLEVVTYPLPRFCIHLCWKVWSDRAPKEPPRTTRARAAATRLQNMLAEKACIIEGALKSKKADLQASANPQTARDTKMSASIHRALEKQPHKPDPELSPWVLHCGQLPVVQGNSRAAAKAHKLKRQQKQETMYAKLGKSSSLSGSDPGGGEIFSGSGHANWEMHLTNYVTPSQEPEYKFSDSMIYYTPNASDDAKSETSFINSWKQNLNNHFVRDVLE